MLLSIDLFLGVCLMCIVMSIKSRQMTASRIMISAEFHGLARPFFTDLSLWGKGIDKNSFEIKRLKGIWWMPWHTEAMKDVTCCDKPRGAASKRIRGFPNGGTQPIRVILR